MARHFKVDTAKKIQAGPVDFSGFSKPLSPEEIESYLLKNRDELENYYEAKVIPIVKQLNSDLAIIMNDYVIPCADFDDGYLDLFEEALNNACDSFLSTDNRDTIAFGQFDYDPSYYIWIKLYADNKYGGDFEDLDQADYTAVVWYDYIYDADESNLCILYPESDSFITTLITVIANVRPIARQITNLEDSVEFCQQAIYEYAEYIDYAFSTIFENALRIFLENE